jgi:hypothetical protein
MNVKNDSWLLLPSRNDAQHGTVAGRVAAWHRKSWEYGKLIGDSTRITMARAATTVPAVGGAEKMP